MRKSVCFCLDLYVIGSDRLRRFCPQGEYDCGRQKRKDNRHDCGRIDKDFYDSEELQGEIESELAEYNKNYATDHITMKKFEVKDGTATLQLVFD